MDKPRIFAIVVTYNGKRWYDRCLGSLQASEVPVTTIVVDNDSSDGSADYIRIHFPEVVLIESDKNLGFAKANNIGIRYAIDNGADYVFLLNQDAWLGSPTTLTGLLQSFVENEKVGIVSPMHVNGEGTALDWNFSTSLPGTCISDLYLNKLHRDYIADYINAAAWLISRQCIDFVGGFDTNLFVHYGEDIDYVHRIHYYGFSLLVNTDCIAYHDRESRRCCNDEYKQRIFHRDEQMHNMKLEYGDINKDIDIEALIISNKKSIIKFFLKGKQAKAKRLKKINELLIRIKNSRSINKEGNRPWI